jgi:predicted ribosome quality control (RQC) complex YloA/Tae2 family protein
MASLPLESALRQREIHPDLPQVKVPAGDLKTCQYHPATGDPFTADDLRHPLLREMLDKYSTPEAALKAQQDAAREVRQRIEESEQKIREIDKDMEEKEKMREIERKIFEKQGKARGGAS